MRDEWDEEDDPEGDDEEEDTYPCPYCGRQIYDDAVQCPYCGTYIEADQIAASRPSVWTRVVTATAVILLVLFLVQIILLWW